MEVPTATLMALSSSFLISVSSGWLVFKRPQYRPCRQRHNPGGSSEWGPQVRRQFSCLPSFSSAFPSPSFHQFWLILFHSIRYCVSIAVILNRLLSHPIILLSCAARIHCANVLGLSMSMHHSANPQGSPCANIRRFAGSSSFMFARRAKTANVVTY